MASIAAIKLAELVKLLEDGAKGYRRLAEGLRGQECLLFCLEESMLREAYRAELARALEGRLETEPTGGTLPGRLHRGWIELEVSLDLSDQILLKTAQRCEDFALGVYRAAQADYDEGDPVRLILDRQAEHLEFAIRRLKELQESSPATLFQPRERRNDHS